MAPNDSGMVHERHGLVISVSLNYYMYTKWDQDLSTWKVKALGQW